MARTSGGAGDSGSEGDLDLAEGLDDHLSQESRFRSRGEARPLLTGFELFSCSCGCWFGGGISGSFFSFFLSLLFSIFLLLFGTGEVTMLHEEIDLSFSMVFQFTLEVGVANDADIEHVSQSIDGLDLTVDAVTGPFRRHLGELPETVNNVTAADIDFSCETLCGCFHDELLFFHK